GHASVRRCKQRILRDDLLVNTCSLHGGEAAALGWENSCTQVKIVGFDTGFISPAPVSQRAAKIIDDLERDLVLDSEATRQLSIELFRPQRKVITCSNELDIDP